MQKGVEKIYRDIKIDTFLTVNQILDNHYTPNEKTVALFSGGVDATYTFLKHKSEDLTLFNIWGADVNTTNYTAHNEMEQYNLSFSKQFDTDYICIKSTLREIFNEKKLNNDGYEIIGDYWWHGAQHSIGLVSLLAPYDWLYKIKTNYIASTFTEEEFLKGIKCISYPCVDDQLNICSTNTHHDGFDAKRIEKVKYICETRLNENLKFDLKVCFNYIYGKNCSSCEKCYRTIASILIFDKNLEKYGFDSNNIIKKIKHFLDTNEIGSFRWEPIKEAYNLYNTNKELKWLKNYKFNNITSFKSRFLRLYDIIKRKFGV